LRIAASTSLAAPSATIAPSLTPTAAAPTLPAGDWTSVHWTKVAVEASVWIVPPDSSDSDSPVDSDDCLRLEPRPTSRSTRSPQPTPTPGRRSQPVRTQPTVFTGRLVVNSHGPARPETIGSSMHPTCARPGRGACRFAGSRIGDPARCGGTEWEFPMATSVDGISWLAAPITDAGEQMVTVQEVIRASSHRPKRDLHVGGWQVLEVCRPTPLPSRVSSRSTAAHLSRRFRCLRRSQHA